eukprot:5349478-Amphidinium_carterae.1
MKPNARNCGKSERSSTSIMALDVTVRQRPPNTFCSHLAPAISEGEFPKALESQLCLKAPPP